MKIIKGKTKRNKKRRDSKQHPKREGEGDEGTVKKDEGNQGKNERNKKRKDSKQHPKIEGKGNEVTGKMKIIRGKEKDSKRKMERKRRAQVRRYR